MPTKNCNKNYQSSDRKKKKKKRRGKNLPSISLNCALKNMENFLYWEFMPVDYFFELAHNSYIAIAAVTIENTTGQLKTNFM